MGFAAAKTEHFAFNLVVIPALATDIVYYSIASCITTRSSGRILSNSSIQQTPPLAITSAPASSVNYPLDPSRVILAVKPAALLPLPLVYTDISLALSMNLRSCDLAVLGSPISKILISPLKVIPSGKILELPPNSRQANASFISSRPNIDGAIEFINVR